MSLFSHCFPEKHRNIGRLGGILGNLFSHCFPKFGMIGKLGPTDYWQNGKETGHYLQERKVRKLYLCPYP